jgi:hypothetical protein
MGKTVDGVGCAVPIHTKCYYVHYIFTCYKSSKVIAEIMNKFNVASYILTTFFRSVDLATVPDGCPEIGSPAERPSASLKIQVTPK